MTQLQPVATSHVPQSYRARSVPRDPEPEPLHDYSSTQVQIIGRPADIIRRMQAQIPASDVGQEGKETNFHCTVKYGLHFQTPSARLREAIRNFGPVTATLGKTSLFANDDADVLKVDVDSPDLRRLNKLISRLVPTHDTHPKYIPHVTIAYLKPGRGKKYVGESALNGSKVTFTSLVFSGKKGHKETIPLSEAVPGPYRVR